MEVSIASSSAAAFLTDNAVESSPLVADGVVYFGSSNGHLYAVDVVIGEDKRSFPTEGILGSSPAMADGTVYFGSYDGNLYALDA